MLPGRTYVPEDLLKIATRHKWWIVIPVVAAAVGAVFATSRLPDFYKSETLILVVPQRVPENFVRPTVTARIEDRLPSIQQQILSRSRLERIILDLNLYPEERKKLVMEDVVEQMRRDIEGPTVERGDAFRVGFVSRDPLLTQKVTERLARLYIDENKRDREVQAEGTSDFLDAQLDDARRRLIEHEKKLEQFKRQYSGELPTQVQANMQAIQNAQLQLQALSETINRDLERRNSIERQITDLESGEAPAPIVVPGVDPPPSSTAQQLEAAITKLRALEVRYKPGHPDLDGAKRQVHELEARLEAESRNVPAPERKVPVTNPGEITRRNRLRALREELTNVVNEISKKQADQSRLQSVVDSYQARIDAAPTRESELVELMRDYNTLQNTYNSLGAKREDSQIAANLEKKQISEQFKVLDQARVPERPFSPNRFRINAMVTFGGLIIGFALVAFFEYRDSSFKTDNDVMRVLQIPVLALVPMMRSEQEIRQKRRRQVFAAVAATMVVLASAAALVVWKLQG